MRRRKFKSRARRKIGRKKVFFVVFVIFALFTLQSFVYIEKNLRPFLLNAAEFRLKQIATEAINSAVSTRIVDGTDTTNLIDWKTDKNGKTTGFMLNYAEHIRITAETKDVVQNILKDTQSMQEEIPIGEAVNSAILATIGPKISIKLVPAGAVKVDLNTRYQNAGINMILIEVYVRITAEVAILVPLDKSTEAVVTEIPISYALVVGDVPTYYFDNKGQPVGNTAPLPPNISLPGLGTS